MPVNLAEEASSREFSARFRELLLCLYLAKAESKGEGKAGEKVLGSFTFIGMYTSAPVKSDLWSCPIQKA